MSLDKLTSLERRRIAKAWGKSWLPLVEKIDVCLGGYGFDFDKVGPDEKWLTWIKFYELGLSHLSGFTLPFALLSIEHPLHYRLLLKCPFNTG